MIYVILFLSELIYQKPLATVEMNMEENKKIKES